jgi:predicted nucleotidyltransferase
MSQCFETEGNQDMLKLTREEQVWLNDYRKAIEGKHPGVVHEMFIYGSKARGQAHAESDLDVLLVVTNEAGDLKKSYAVLVTCWPRPRMFFHLSLRTPSKSGKAGKGTGPASVRRSNVTQCASYEPEYGYGRVEQGSRSAPGR